MKGVWIYKEITALGAALAIVYYMVAAGSICKAETQEYGTWQKLLPPSEWINVLTTTPWGIYAGQKVDRYGAGAYNGLYFSKDLGNTWKSSGLAGRGISDLKYSEGKLYAATYYEKDESNGLFVSEDKGETWQHKGPVYQLSRIEISGENMLLGSTNNGLWVGNLKSDAFRQVIEARKGPAIYGLYCQSSLCLCGLARYSFISNDFGETWTEIPDLEYKIPVDFLRKEKVILASTYSGLYISKDYGDTFNLVQSLGLHEFGELFNYKNNIYVSRKESDYTNKLFVSKDEGETWEDTTISLNKTGYPLFGITWAFSEPEFVFVSGYGNGVHRYSIIPYQPKGFPFLGKLWDSNSFEEQTDAITAYFDHTYPLLSSWKTSEPLDEITTTTNFYGERGEEPYMYYSSHDGIDFGLSYGTPILAPAGGTATYAYSNLGGHSIKIDHQNGYQTLYLHLQKMGLITSSSESVDVKEKDQIGLVGLTGRTTGPHLHFSVLHDKDGNGLFSDNIPDGSVDPYAWFSDDAKDPWPQFSWEEGPTTRVGSESKYLWYDQLHTFTRFLDEEGGTLSTPMVELYIPRNILEYPSTLIVRKVPGTKDLTFEKYIQNTHVDIGMYDLLKNPVNISSGAFDITFDLSSIDLSTINTNTLIIKFYNPSSRAWENVNSYWDEIEKKLKASLNHLSEFAVFGQAINLVKPISSLTLRGVLVKGWYVSHPVPEVLSVGTDVEKTLISYDDGVSWEDYIPETPIQKEGVFAMLYRSMDTSGNIEDAKESELIKINTLGKPVDEVVFKSAEFKTIAITE